MESKQTKLWAEILSKTLFWFLLWRLSYFYLIIPWISIAFCLAYLSKSAAVKVCMWNFEHLHDRTEYFVSNSFNKFCKRGKALPLHLESGERHIRVISHFSFSSWFNWKVLHFIRFTWRTKIWIRSLPILNNKYVVWLCVVRFGFLTNGVLTGSS